MKKYRFDFINFKTKKVEEHFLFDDSKEFLELYKNFSCNDQLFTEEKVCVWDYYSYLEEIIKLDDDESNEDNARSIITYDEFKKGWEPYKIIDSEAGFLFEVYEDRVVSLFHQYIITELH